MKVAISFELDLSKLIKNNQDNVLLAGRSIEDVVEELKEMFDGDIQKGLSEDCKNLYTQEFTDLFNY